MTDGLTCTACDAGLTYTSGTIGVISTVGDRWAGAVIECGDYAPIVREEGNTETAVEKMSRSTPEAEERARKLLMKFLGKRRFKKAEKSGFIDIASKLYAGRIYRIPFRGGRIQVEENGKKIDALCFNVRGDPLPWGDRILARALFAEYDEEKLLEIANHFSPDSGNEGYGDCDG